MCAPCKVLLNGAAAQGKLIAYEKGIAELNRRGADVADSTLKKAIDLICGFDGEMDELLKLVHEGPHVPYVKQLRHLV